MSKRSIYFSIIDFLGRIIPFAKKVKNKNQNIESNCEH